MSSYTIGYDKGYQCPCCNTFFNDVDPLIENSWKCPYCKEYISIAAPDLGHGHTLIRKSVTELVEGDLVHIPGYEDIYPIIAIEYQGTDKICVAFKGYCRVTYKVTDFVSVINGGYYEYHWKDNPFAPCR